MSDQSSEDDFLRSLGTALRDWQIVEMALARLLGTALRTPDPRAADELIYSVPNFRDKLAIVDSAVRFTVARHRTLVPAWNTLHRKVQAKAQRRNTIIHSHPWGEPVGDGEMRYRLGPHMRLSEVDGMDQIKDFVDTKQIFEAAASFRNLAQQLNDYNSSVGEFLVRKLGAF